MPVTDQQARALAFLAAAARPHGARRWDEAGILAAIKTIAHWSLDEACIEVMSAAGDRSAVTPGVIGKPGAHRRPRPTSQEARPTYDPSKVCHICGHRTEEHHQGTHEFLSVAAARAVPSTKAPAAVRTAIAPAPRSWGRGAGGTEPSEEI